MDRVGVSLHHTVGGEDTPGLRRQLHHGVRDGGDGAGGGEGGGRGGPVRGLSPHPRPGQCGGGPRGQS